jgi:catechol 2,3-dioxygenase-like lactoylglutathione lyase family enzyme
MLGSKNVMADVAVADLAAAKAFYVGTLGLRVVKEDEHEMILTSGASKVHVYKSQYAGTNQATTASWLTDDVAGAVVELKAKGVSFERYDMPGTTHEGDVHVMGNVRAAWFKDPDGNILCVGNEG